MYTVLKTLRKPIRPFVVNIVPQNVYDEWGDIESDMLMISLREFSIHVRTEFGRSQSEDRHAGFDCNLRNMLVNKSNV